MQESSNAKPTLGQNALPGLLSSQSCFYLAAIIVFYRFFVLYLVRLNLHFDEIQYWLWSYLPALQIIRITFF